MKVSGTVGAVCAFVLVGVVGCGVFLFKNVQETRQRELALQTQNVKLKVREAARQEAEANEKAKAAEAKAAEARRRQAEAERERAAKDLQSKRQEAETAKARKAAADAESAKAVKARAAAEAETARANAAAKRAEAEKSVAEAKAKAEEVALKRAVEERLKAEAEFARAAAAKAVADAALAKSENERKTAEANAAAEHDRKLRMYRRAESSRAEMIELQKAERLLAMEEAGVAMPQTEQAAEADMAENDNAAAAPTQAVAAVQWPDVAAGKGAAASGLAMRDLALDARERRERRLAAREHVGRFMKLVESAVRDGRSADAAYYRKTLATIVPNYPLVFTELMEDARKAKRQDMAETYCSDLMALTPDWARVGVMVDLIDRDEAYYSGMLAGRVSKEEFVKAFRKRYDRARRNKGDRDEREEEMESICRKLAEYVPDFERSPEWK